MVGEHARCGSQSTRPQVRDTPSPPWGTGKATSGALAPISGSPVQDSLVRAGVQRGLIWTSERLTGKGGTAQTLSSGGFIDGYKSQV